MKNLLTIVLLVNTVGLFAEPKAEFSLVVRPVESTVKVGSPVQVEVRKTNLTNRALPIGSAMYPGGRIYTYEVRRDGISVAETEFAKNLKEPSKKPCSGLCVETVNGIVDSSLPPHGTETEIVPVNTYRDMSQPGKYTIQLQEGKVKSNIVTVTVEP